MKIRNGLSRCAVILRDLPDSKGRSKQWADYPARRTSSLSALRISAPLLLGIALGLPLATADAQFSSGDPAVEIDAITVSALDDLRNLWGISDFDLAVGGISAEDYETTLRGLNSRISGYQQQIETLTEAIVSAERAIADELQAIAEDEGGNSSSDIDDFREDLDDAIAAKVAYIDSTGVQERALLPVGVRPFASAASARSFLNGLDRLASEDADWVALGISESTAQQRVDQGLILLQMIRSEVLDVD